MQMEKIILVLAKMSEVVSNKTFYTEKVWETSSRQAAKICLQKTRRDNTPYRFFFLYKREKGETVVKIIVGVQWPHEISESKS